VAAPVKPTIEAPRIAIFNHKGGVGKTTLTTNIGFAMVRRGKRVLLVDSDPQCNLTAYLVEETVVNDLLDNSDSEAGQTLWSAVKRVSDATGDIRPVDALELREGLFLLPGDVRLAEFEQELHGLWSEAFKRRPRGFRGIVALSQLVTLAVERYRVDYVFFDSGPNIGALNRSILLDCDYFGIPAACDLFSVRAIKTLGYTLENWVRDWTTLSDLAPDDSILFEGRPRVLGYIPQRFRIYRERPAKDYASFIPLIERAVQEDVIERLRRLDPPIEPARADALKLGEVKDFGALAPASQREGVALNEVKSANDDQRQAALEAFDELAGVIIQRTAAPAAV
jgi:cellulose biosynthesis protein BcsQ